MTDEQTSELKDMLEQLLPRANIPGIAPESPNISHIAKKRQSDMGAAGVGSPVKGSKTPTTPKHKNKDSMGVWSQGSPFSTPQKVHVKNRSRNLMLTEQ